MKTRLSPAVICVLVLTVVAGLAFAQDAETETSDAPDAATSDPLEDEGQLEVALTWDDYTIKGYSISIYGGSFGGDRYLDLPVKSDRTQVQEGSDWVMSYDGTWFTPDELDYGIYDGPVKVIGDGYTVGLRLGSYLSESFHVDLSFAYSASDARLTMVNTEENITEEIDRDDSIQVFRGSATMMYDFTRAQLVGIYPYFGFGFGGVINRFSNLPDVGALFLTGSLGIKRHIAGTASLFFQFDLTTYAMSRQELNYTETVHYTDLMFGVSFYIDRIPAQVRELREAEMASGDPR